MSRTIAREIALLTKARHGTIGQPATECAAFVRFYSEHPTRPILVIDNTGGQWYLSTLLGVDDYHGFSVKTPSEMLAIDAGQRWVLFNPRELVSEALARVLGETPTPPGACPTCKGNGGKCIICEGTGKARAR